MTTTYLAYIPSPSQGVWHIGPVPLRAYALFIIVGIVVALVLGDRRWVARGGQAGVIYDIALWAVPFGLVGGRLYHVMTDWRTYFGEDGAGLAGALRIWDGGLGIWGAVALGGVGAWIGCRQKGIPLPAFGDAIAPGIILAQAIGRLGNYFNQELYGRPTTLPWGLEIYERRDASGALDTLNGASTGQLIEVVHPTFLYELLWNVLIFAALIYIDRRFKIGHGRLFAAYVAGYCLGRFWIELMRSDVATHFAGIRVNSFTSTFVFIGAVVYIMVAPKGREDPASLVGKPEDEGVAVPTFGKELAAVAATTGVVAAAKAAGAVEDEDVKAAAADAVDDKTDEPEAGLGVVEGEEAVEVLDAAPEAHDAEAEAADEAEAVADDVVAEADTEAEESDTDEGDEAEAVADEVVDEPEPEAEAEAEPEAEAEAEPEAGLGVVEGDEAVEALDAAPEVHDAAVEAADDAETVADEVASEDEAKDLEAEPEPEAGLGVVEGDEAVEALDAAPEVHDAAVEAADEAEAVADEVAAGESDGSQSDEQQSSEAAADAAESDDSETDESETEDAEAAVEEAVAESSEDEAAEEAEAVVDEADAAADDEPKTGVLEEVRRDRPAAEPEPADEPETAAEAPAPAVQPAPAEESGGRLGRWLRRSR